MKRGDWVKCTSIGQVLCVNQDMVHMRMVDGVELWRAKSSTTFEVVDPPEVWKEGDLVQDPAGSLWRRTLEGEWQAISNGVYRPDLQMLRPLRKMKVVPQ